MKSRARLASTLGKELVEKTGLEGRDMGHMDPSFAQLSGPPVGSLAALNALDARVRDTQISLGDVDVVILPAGSMPSTVEPPVFS
jgi:hypothetical protein